VLFGASLLLRLLFWRATPDRDWGWSAYLKGDAPLWLEYARALQLGETFELGIPIHPPGTAWVASLVWDGVPAHVAVVRFAWVVLGALVPLLLFLAAERSFGLRAAALAGSLTAVATSLLVLSTTVCSETPYLVLTLASLYFVEDLLGEPRAGRLAAFSALSSVACLFRAEHLLFFLPALLFFALRWERPFRRAAAALVFFALPLVPWHLHAWSSIRRFNEEPRVLTPIEEKAVGAVEQALRYLPWDAEALRKRAELPGFARRTATAFVLATVGYRGGTEVHGSDFRILEEAFGSTPRRLGRFPFVTSYGPLNFALANHAGARGGFERAPLEARPPLTGGADRYPPFLVQGLPPPQLTFFYPPHLELFNDGYAIGWRWIASNPAAFARLAARKLAIFWSGAASGATGWFLSGRRRAVDMVTSGSRLWSIGVLLGAITGAVAGARRSALQPWLLFLASKVLVTLAFFGYARQGALIVPVLALLAALAVERWVPAATRLAPALLLTVALLAEAGRALARPEMRLDGQPVGASDPVPPDDPRAVELSVGRSRS